MFKVSLINSLVVSLFIVHKLSAQEIVWQDHDKKLSIVKIESKEERVFKNLQLCYECEFASITQTPMTMDGDYDQEELASHWSKIVDLMLFYHDTIPAGFIVVNHGSMIQDNPDVHDVGEFYITPIFRKKGYGKLFAQEIFKLYGGSWEVRQLLELEKTARSFWHKVITSLDHENFQEFVNHPNWSGYFQYFTIK